MADELDGYQTLGQTSYIETDNNYNKTSTKLELDIGLNISQLLEF